MRPDDRARDRSRGGLVAATLALGACIGAPRELTVAVRDDAGPVAALQVVTTRGTAHRCTRLDVASISAPYTIAVTAELADDAAIAIVAVDATGAPIASGVAHDDAPTLATVAHRLPRAHRTRATLADGVAGHQLAFAGATAAAIWLDVDDELPVRARRIDQRADGFADQPAPSYFATDLRQPVITAVGAGYVAAWIDGDAIVARALQAPDPAPVDGFGAAPIASIDPSLRARDPALVPSGDRALALWIETAPGEVTGRLVARWLDARASADTPARAYPGPAQAPSGAAVDDPSTAAIIGWIQGTNAATSIALGTVGADGTLGAPRTLEVAGSMVTSVALAPAAGGRVAVAWTEHAFAGARARIALVDASLTVVAGPFELGPSARSIALAARPRGLVAGWISLDTDRAAYVRWLDADGQPTRQPTRAGWLDGAQDNLSIAAPSIDDGDDRIALAWDQAAASATEIVGRLARPTDDDAPPEECP